tara:strand:- start:256 stop:693 length:438 start_codon:yes stop_codon:yes gene_type:complete
MSKFLSIDPGKNKCGLIIADLVEKKVCKAEVIQSNMLLDSVRKIKANESKIKVIIGNGTTSKFYIDKLRLLAEELIIAEEKNTTLRAKQRYFDLFPLEGVKKFLPREIFLSNINLDAIAALVILEDFCQFKLILGKDVESKTWKK